MNLDIDGTNWRDDDPNEPCIHMSLDGSGAEMIADYNQMPFPDNTFDRIEGACYLEGSDGAYYEDEWYGRNNLAEVYRVLKPGGTARFGSCCSYYVQKIEDRVRFSLRDSIRYRTIFRYGRDVGTGVIDPAGVQDLLNAISQRAYEAAKAGFRSVRFEYEDRGDEPRVSEPWLHLVK